MKITSVQKVEIQKHGGTVRDMALIATIDNEEIYVPVTVGNRHYDEIMRQVDAGELTIADAE
jgi:hypothetical protein